MNAFIRWMASNHVAANLLMLVFVAGGLIMAGSVKQEVFPEISLEMIRVQVAYPGAGPEEIEDGIILKIEENIDSLDGVKKITSTAAEGMGTVMVELRTGEDPNLILQDVKNEVDRITTFPEEAEEPIISKVLNRREVISVLIYGDLSERTLREYAEQVRDELLEDEGITQVDLGGVRPYEISIQVAEEDLRRYNLTLDEVAGIVRRASLDIPGGTIKTSGQEILLRTKEKRYTGAEYAEIIVLTRPDGTVVRLGDIAQVRDGFEDIDLKARLDGKPASMVKIFRVGDEKPTGISDTVREYVEQKRLELPSSVGIDVWNDTSEIFEGRMNLLLKNAALGLGLVIIILGLFLEIRLALWVMLGIPISFLGTLFLLPAMDVSINMISLFAFILALGILVDDAIVVGENVYSHREAGRPFREAAGLGAQEVALPVTFSILTTVAAFLPLMFVSGMMGKFIGVIPKVVITLLLVSLVECLFVLPAHLALGRKREAPRGVLGGIDRVRRWFGNKLETFTSGPYQRFLRLCLHNRYATAAAGLATLLLVAGVVGGGIIKFTFMPKVDGDVIMVSIKMPEGVSIAATDAVAKRLVETGSKVAEGYERENGKDGSILRHIYAVVGGSIEEGGPHGGSGASATNRSDIAMFLVKSEERHVTATEIANRWRMDVGEIPGVDSITFTSNLIRLGANIDIALAHEDFDVLERAMTEVKTTLSEYPGVSDIEDSYARGKRELKLTLTSEARTLGITEEDLGRQVRAAFFGAEALRLQRGRNEVKVMVRYPEEDRTSLEDLEDMRIRTPQGGEIPLFRAARVEEGLGFSAINRSERKRVVNITASVDDKVNNAQDILAELKSGLLSRLTRDYPGLTYDLEGEEEERQESLASMGKGFLLALFGIFVLLALPFRSYSQPFLIMSAIPFGLVGAVVGHLIMGYDLSILSLFGLVALAGVVVNDSLLLIDRINTNRRQGGDMIQAVVDGGQRRLRPILLTSLTTFFGLMPMILERSVQAKFLIPMAISLGFGILFATGITLVLIPSFYVILEDIRGLFGLSPAYADHWKNEAGSSLPEAGRR